MATQLESEKAKRAATKALKQHQQELEDQELIESTCRKFSLICLYGYYLLFFMLNGCRASSGQS